MNRGEVRDKVRIIIQEPFATGTWTNPMLNEHIDLAYVMMVNKVRDLNYKYYYNTTTVTTANGTRNYDLPSDCVASNIINIRDSDGYSLVSEDINNFNPEETGAKANYYDILNNDIYLFPEPTSVKVYTLEYLRVPTVLAADATELDFPQGHEDVVAYKAAISAKKALDDIYEDIESDFNLLYKSMVKSIGHNKNIKPPQIAVSRNEFGVNWINQRTSIRS